MNNLVILAPQKTTHTPDVHLDSNHEEGYIRGESYQEAPCSFYEEISAWFKDYFKMKDSFKLVIELSYINSSCSRSLVGLFKELRAYRLAGKKIVVDWYCESDDSEMMENGKDFMAASQFKINLITTSS